MKRVLILVLLMFLSCGDRNDDIIAPEGDDVIAEGKIDQDGGEIEITDQDNEYYGLRIEMPAGAVTQETIITIEKTSVRPALPADITSAKTPLKIESTIQEFDKCLFR